VNGFEVIEHPEPARLGPMVHQVDGVQDGRLAHLSLGDGRHGRPAQLSDLIGASWDCVPAFYLSGQRSNMLAGRRPPKISISIRSHHIIMS
jgi:hypothetical protein